MNAQGRAIEYEQRVASGSDLDGLLERCGADMQASWRGRSVDGLSDLFHDLCDASEAMTLVECGAHDATASRRFRRADPRRIAVAVEANPEVFESQTQSAVTDGVVVVPEGLASSPGILPLLISAKSTMTSFRRQTKEKGAVVREVEVPVTTVDLLQERIGFEPPLALWVDVEGMPREVLEGARSTLDDTVVVMVEVQEAGIWVGEDAADDVDALLISHDLVPIARDFQTGDRLYNVVYVRNTDSTVAALTKAYWDGLLVRPKWARLRIAAKVSASFAKRGRDSLRHRLRMVTRTG